jgi:hypothetical protein
MEHAFTLPHIYQFWVVVQGISPLIWRRILIRSDMSLATLHAALQIVFTWSDVHLHYFRIHGKEYGCPRVGGPHFEDDPRHVPLSQLRLHRGSASLTSITSSITGSVTSGSKPCCPWIRDVTILSASGGSVRHPQRTVAAPGPICSGLIATMSAGADGRCCQGSQPPARGGRSYHHALNHWRPRHVSGGRRSVRRLSPIPARTLRSS